MNLIASSCLVTCLVVSYLAANCNAKDDVTSSSSSSTASLDLVSVDKLSSLVQHSNYAVVLITAQNGSGVSEAETLLAQLKGELQEQLQSPVLKLQNSSLVTKKYNIERTPSILFFRNNAAIIFDGPFEWEYVMDWIFQNLKSSVRLLNDESFEHLTQAATGATTGDWFVLFCRMNENSCQSLQPVWESVASRLKSRLNIAFVDTSKNPELVMRFKIDETPAFIFFRLGKMYHYHFNKYDITSFTGFASGWYKNVKAEIIPQLPTPFDNLIDRIVQKVQKELEDPYVVPAIVMLCLPFSIVLAAVYAKGRNYKSKPE